MQYQNDDDEDVRKPRAPPRAEEETVRLVTLAVRPGHPEGTKDTMGHQLGLGRGLGCHR